MRKIIFKAIVLVFLLAGCNNTSQTVIENPKNDIVTATSADKKQDTFTLQDDFYVPNYKDISLKTDSVQLNEISKELYDKYLKSFTKINVTQYARISDYKIEDIKIESSNINKFQFYVKYSINPASEKYVLVGNGVQESDGWIRHRVYFVNVEKEDEVFKIKGIGTAP